MILSTDRQRQKGEQMDGQGEISIPHFNFVEAGHQYDSCPIGPTQTSVSQRSNSFNKMIHILQHSVKTLDVFPLAINMLNQGLFCIHVVI